MSEATASTHSQAAERLQQTRAAVPKCLWLQAEAEAEGIFIAVAPVEQEEEAQEA